MSVGLPDEGKEDRLMKPANASAIPLDMEQARQELEAWRSTHRPRCHIPDSLWKKAAELASQHGLYLTSRTLRVDYMRLKKLVQPTSPQRKTAELRRSRSSAATSGAHTTVVLLSTHRIHSSNAAFSRSDCSSVV